MPEKPVIVVGGGVIGVCTAYYLARSGRHVLLLEQGELCGGSSRGNAGQITPGHLPLPQPGMLTRNLRWLLSRTSPLYIPPRFDPALWGWLLRFLRACTAEHLEHATRILCRLGEASYRLFDELAGECGFRYRKTGRLEVCRTGRSLAATRREAALLHRFGFDYEVLSPAQCRQREPALTGAFAGAVYYPQSAACDPYQFVAAVASAAGKLGAEIRPFARVAGVRLEGDQISAVTLETGEAFAAAATVFACGAWPAPIARRLRLPVQPGKGYHLDVVRPTNCPATAVVFVEEKIFTNSQPGFLRLAGTMELSGHNLRPHPARLAALRSGAARYLPEIMTAQALSTWCHWRPMTPDGLPVIDRIPGCRNGFVATGHGMLGVTQGPVTGELLTRWINGEEPEIELSPLRADRFGGGHQPVR